jgi:hypothetical protein
MLAERVRHDIIHVHTDALHGSSPGQGRPRKRITTEREQLQNTQRRRTL